MEFKLKGNKKNYGQLKQLFFHGTEDMVSSDANATITVTNHNGDTSDEIRPISKIHQKLSAEAFKKLGKAAKQKLPASLKIFAEDKVELPPTELVAGDALKWVNVAIYDGQSTPAYIKKWDKAEKVTLRVLKDKTVVLECDSSTMYKPGKMSFKNINCFTQSGTYIMEFSSTISTIKTIKHEIEVRAAEVASYAMIVDGEGELFHSGVPIPRIEIEGRDQYDNPVPIEVNSLCSYSLILCKDTSELEFEATPKEDKSIVLPITDSPHFDLIEGKFIITNLVITSRTRIILFTFFSNIEF